MNPTPHQYAEWVRAVQRGIDVLDERKPEWRSLVDVQKLDLFCTTHCILGQVYGAFYLGKSGAGLDEVGDCRQHGMGPTSTEQEEFQRALWIEAIQDGR